MLTDNFESIENCHSEDLGHDCLAVSSVRERQPPAEWAHGRRPAKIPLQGVSLLWHARDERRGASGPAAPRRAPPSGTVVTAGDGPDHRDESQHDHEAPHKKVFQPIAATITPSRERPILERDE
jgi:hypothetical protein